MKLLLEVTLDEHDLDLKQYGSLLDQCVNRPGAATLSLFGVGLDVTIRELKVWRKEPL